MKELPKNWWCKCTKHNQKILSKWKDFNDYSVPIGHVVGWIKNTDINESSKEYNQTPECKGYDFGTEISFETFERLVLRINKQIIIEIW